MDTTDSQFSQGIQLGKRIMYVKLNSRQTRSEVCHQNDHFSVIEESEWPQTSQYHQQQMMKQEKAYEQQIRRINDQIDNIQDQQNKLLLQQQSLRYTINEAQPRVIRTMHRQIDISSMLDALRQKEGNAETQLEIRCLQIYLKVLREKVKVVRQERRQYLASWQQLCLESMSLSDKIHQKIIDMDRLQLQVDRIKRYLQIRSTVRIRQYIPDFR